MKNVTIDSDNYQLPTGWNELTRNQLIEISRLSMLPDTVTAIRTKALWLLLGLQVMQKKEIEVDGQKCFYIAHGNKKVYLMKDCDIAALTHHINFMFRKNEDDDGNITYQFRSRLFRQLIPVLEINIIKDNDLYGPADGLNNITFGEFILCENYYSAFLKSQDIADAALLIATMYRPEAAGYNIADPLFKADRREQLNEALLKKRAGKIYAKIDKAMLQAILFFYEGCKYFLSGKFPRVFDNSSDEGHNNGSKQSALEGYIKLTASLANNDATKIETWMNTNLYSVLFALENILIEQKKLEELYKTK